MDKNSESYERKKKYNAEYNKRTYKKITFSFKPEFSDEIDRFCIAHNMNKTELAKNALTEYMEKHEFD